MDTPLVSRFWQDLNNFTRIASAVADPAKQLLRTIDVQPLSALRDHSGEKSDQAERYASRRAPTATLMATGIADQREQI
jgi:hypothetical protein